MEEATQLREGLEIGAAEIADAAAPHGAVEEGLRVLGGTTAAFVKASCLPPPPTAPQRPHVRHVPPLPSALVQAYLRYCATLRYVTGTSRRPSIESPAVKHAFPTDFRGAIAVFNDQEAFTAAKNGKAAAAKGGTPGGGPCGDLARMCRCCIGLPQI